MNTNLLGNLEGNTPKVKIDNGNRRQGRGVLGLVLLALFGLMFLMPASGWAQESDPFTVTTEGDTVLYWIEAVGADGFYIIPDPNQTNASTTNAPNLLSLWYVLDAGIDDNKQYYYFVNYVTGKYLKLTGNLGDHNSIGVGNNEADKCKFYVQVAGTNWAIRPKSGVSSHTVNKRGGNVSYGSPYFLKASTAGVTDVNSQWNFIEKDEVNWPQPSLPFVVSNNAGKHYFNIQNANPDASQWYMSTMTNSGNEYASISNENTTSNVWYFEEAPSDSDNDIPNLKYYYIVNASGKFMKFIKTANGSNQDDAIQMTTHSGSETGEDEKRFQFAIVNAKGGSYSAYSIMPRLCIGFYDNKSNSLKPKANSNNSRIQIANDRGSEKNSAHWNFVVSEYSTACDPPIITVTYGETNITITMSAEEGASIYFTLNGSDPVVPTAGNPPASPTQLYDPTNKPTITERTVVKAIAVKAGYDNSSIARTTIVTNPTLELATGPYIYNRSAHTPLLHVNDVYGDTDVTEVIDPAEYTVSYANNINATTSTSLATITITDNPGGDYIVNGSTTFTIEPMSIGDGGNPVSGITITVGSSGNGYTVTVKHGSETLTQGTDYTWVEGPGTEEVTVTGQNNYTGSAKGHYVSVTPGYYALHKSGVGYLKRYSDNVTLGNSANFNYANSFSADGSCIWILDEGGHLQSDYYYLNVTGNNQLFLSVNAMTQWKTEDLDNQHGKKRIKTTINGQDYYLRNNSGTIQLTTTQSNAYNACPIDITEVTGNDGWTGPFVNASVTTMQSPQQITYLRNCYFVQKFNYSFYNDNETETEVAENDKERRVFVRLTYNTSTDENKGTKWDVDASNSILYLYNTQTSDYTITATYNVVPADSRVPASHLTAVQQEISFKLQPKTIKPSSELNNKNYILFSIYGGDSFRYPYDTVILQVNDPVKPDGKGGIGIDSDLSDPAGNNGDAKVSWTVEIDNMGFYMFKNSVTHRYFYFDENANSDFGTLRVGDVNQPSDDTRYKFRLFKTTDSGGFGTCYYIIPYSKQFVVFKNDGVSASIYAALNSADYTNRTTPVISLHQPVDNSKWLIYKYEAEYRVRTDFVLSGPSATSSTGYTDPFITEGWYGKYIKESPSTGDLQLSMVIKGSYNDSNLMNYIWTIDGLNAYINTSGGTPSGTTGTTFTVNGNPSYSINVTSLPVSAVTGTVQLQLQGGGGTPTSPKTLLFTIYGDGNVTLTSISSLSEIDDPNGAYKLTADNTYSSSNKPQVTTFSGILDCDGHTINNLTAPLFTNLTNGTVRNLNLKGVSICGSGPTGAIAGTANGASRIYNCGILPTTTMYDENGNISGFAGDTISSTNGYCGSLVGLLDGYARVINCFSYATIAGGSTVAGIVGYNNVASSQTNLKTIVMNCMFYGEIAPANTTSYHPVYGGNSINNDSDEGINPYDYFRKNATFDNNYAPDNINVYKRSWPAEEKNLVRFEYYRSVLNSNRRLCTWWVNGTNGTAPTDADVTNVGIYKWVLDKTIAPYPILKKWGKYPSIINIDTVNVYNTRTHSNVLRTAANEWEGKRLGSLKVNVNAGEHNNNLAADPIYLTITDVDTMNYDYCAYKVQLPYYNEIFGNPNGTTHAAKYGNNYTDKVVTGWMITEVTTDGTVQYNSFNPDWQVGYNFADRKCIDKDKNSVSKRVFAQGGYYYVPEGVTEISITAKWGNAVYLSNRGYSIDRVKVAIGERNNYKADKPFTPAGTVEETFQGHHVYNDWQEAIKALGTATVSNNIPSLTVYDQAIVLIGNHQVKNGSKTSNGSTTDDLKVDNTLENPKKWHPFTIMSADFDFDNEPDFCMQLQFRDDVDRPAIQPVRFDFLPVVELGLAVRPNNLAYAIGIMVPQGHFEVTETSFMRTTQFEFFHNSMDIIEPQSPIIINGGEYELFNVRRPESNSTYVNRTSYFLLGGHAWVHRFAPGPHPNNAKDPSLTPQIALCAVNAIGGEYLEFYLSGINRPDHNTPENQNPHCYTNGGKFGTMAGAGYEEIKCDSVTFRINRSLIGEFYGGGMNGVNPVRGKIDVVIDNSRVKKYCGGPQVGRLGTDTQLKTVTTRATGTIFGTFFGGGNGGNSYFRDNKDDGDWASSKIGDWDMRAYRWKNFNPLGIVPYGPNYDSIAFPDSQHTGSNDKTTQLYFDTINYGYHARYEYETFNQSNGVKNEVTMRGFIHWIQFGTTITSNVTNTLKGCTVEDNFYGGGNLGTVTGTVTSILDSCTVLGNVFGAGYSADVPTFNIHDKIATQTPPKNFPTIDAAGTITDGTTPLYDVDHGTITYKWTNDLHGMTKKQRVREPGYYNEEDGKWYCYTWQSLEGLGAVSSNVTLTISGNSSIGTFENGVVKHGTGNVYGGGDESTVGGNTLVKILDRTRVFSNIYGGGNMGTVGGDTKVIINGTAPETQSGNANNNNPNH